MSRNKDSRLSPATLRKKRLARAKLRAKQFTPFAPKDLLHVERAARGYVNVTCGSEYTIGPVTVLRLLSTLSELGMQPQRTDYERGMKVRLRNPGPRQPKGIGVISGRPNKNSVMTRVTWPTEDVEMEVYLDQLVEVKVS